jgi:oligosaccharide repeat unit polymerase
MVAWAFTILFLGYAGYLAWGRQGSHVAGVIWCAVWGLMLLLYRLVGTAYDYKAIIIMWTGVFVMLFMAGFHASAFAIGFRSKHAGDDSGARYYDFKWLRTALIGTVIIGIGAPIKFAATAGISPSRILNIVGYFDVIQDTHAQLLQGTVEQDPINKICLMVALAGSTLGGIYLGLGRPGRKAPTWLCLAPIGPFFLMMLLTTVRGFVITPLVLLFCAYVAGMTVKGVERKLFRPAPIFISVGVLMFLIAMILIMQSIRMGDYQFRAMGDTVAHMRPWVAGYMPALSVWYYKIWDHQLLWGALSFKGIVSLFGMQGEGFSTTFDQMQIGMNQTSNAMTCLRIFINDFGLAGGVTAGLIFGLIAGALSELSRKGSIVAAVFLSTVLAAVVWAPNSWFLAYGIRLLSPFIAFAYVIAFVRRASPPANERQRPVGRPRIQVRVRTPAPESTSTTAF